VAEEVVMPAGYAIWSGQFEYLERATERMKVVVPATLAVIFVLLYLLFRNAADALLVMAAVPFSLVGGFWLVWLLGHAISVATAVGFIALAGVAAEFGVVMLVYLENALKQRLAAGAPDNETHCSPPSVKAPCCACGPRP
jgi:Cu(I)/Ag(I) efflux system membrane protein CusA/SilA